MCAGTVAEVIQSVVNGADGCVFCFGHSKLGNAHTHIGYRIRACAACESSVVCMSARQCVSLSLGCLSTGPHLSETERGGLVSAEAESFLSLLCLCFCRPLSGSLIPLKLGF